MSETFQSPAKIRTFSMSWVRPKDTSINPMNHEDYGMIQDFLRKLEESENNPVPTRLVNNLTKLVNQDFTDLEKGLLRDALRGTGISKLGVFADNYNLRQSFRDTPSEVSFQTIETELEQVFRSVKNLLLFNGFVILVTTFGQGKVEKHLTILDSVIVDTRLVLGASKAKCV